MTASHEWIDLGRFEHRPLPNQLAILRAHRRGSLSSILGTEYLVRRHLPLAVSSQGHPGSIKDIL
jgi:hypothetical protein